MNYCYVAEQHSGGQYFLESHFNPHFTSAPFLSPQKSLQVSSQF
jgi:hypothetical protein